MNDRLHEVVWDEKKVQAIADAIKNTNRILVGLGGGMPMAAGMEILPFDKKVKAEEYWPFWYPYIKAQRLNTEAVSYTHLTLPTMAVV